VAANTADTLDGAASYAFSVAGQSLHVCAASANTWYIL
jgi:hypothetical protein